MEKKELRAQIKALKKQHTKEQLMEQSEKILAKLEQHPDFIKAEKIMLYSALPDEVQTQAFLEKWHLKKTIILPTVVGDDIIPVEFAKDTGFAVGDFNILEPQTSLIMVILTSLSSLAWPSTARATASDAGAATTTVSSANTLK